MEKCQELHFNDTLAKTCKNPRGGKPDKDHKRKLVSAVMKVYKRM
jgi:hypothetical protein